MTFLEFEQLGENLPNFSCHIWNHKSVLLLTLHWFQVSWKITLLYSFSWRFGQREPNNVQNFRLSTAHVKFQQICTLISSFCWKYIKFQPKKCRGFMSHDTEELFEIQKKIWFVVSKMAIIWWILTWALEILKISTLIGSFCAKYITFDLKKYRGVIFHNTEE